MHSHLHELVVNCNKDNQLHLIDNSKHNIDIHSDNHLNLMMILI